MRIGLIGTGRIGAAHAAVLVEHPEVSDLVLTDVDPERARAVATELGVRHVPDADALLNSQHVDALVIAAATDAHTQLLLASIEAGLPVFCEKPVAPDLPGTVQVLRAAEHARARVHIGFQRRFDAGYARARAALAAGELGTLHRVHALTCDPAPPPPAYIPASGGLFRDCHVHDFDAVRWVTGQEVVDVLAHGANRGADYFHAAGDVDTAVALLRLTDGTLVTVQGSRYNGAGYDVRMELAGTEASIAVGLDERLPIISAEPAARFPEGLPWPNFWERFGPAYRAEISAFVDMAAGHRDTPCGVADALEALLIAEAAELSRTQGRVVGTAEVRPQAVAGAAKGAQA